MKKSLRFSAIVLVAMFPFFASAKVWRVNNNPGISADFATPQAAHNAAAAGDTLHIEPSSANYGNIVVSKRLTIISVGNFLGADANLQYSPVTGMMQNLTITNSIAAGSVFHCNFSGSVTVTGVNNLTFERTFVGGGFVFNNSDNNVVKQSFIFVMSLKDSSSNNLITNNIFNSYIEVQPTSSATITNNVLNINNSSGCYSCYIEIHNSIFRNNIIDLGERYAFGAGSIVDYNLQSNSGAGTVPAGSGNQTGVNMSNVFVNANGTNDKDYQLSSGSLASGAGANGEDAGAFGGATPFKLGLQPAIPAIYKLTAPSTTVGNTLDIVFSTRSNN